LERVVIASAVVHQPVFSFFNEALGSFSGVERSLLRLVKNIKLLGVATSRVVTVPYVRLDRVKADLAWRCNLVHVLKSEVVPVFL